MKDVKEIVLKQHTNLMNSRGGLINNLVKI